MEKRELDQLIGEMAPLEDFMMEIMDYLSRGRDYGTGEKMNMVEIHTLALIADRPGLCITDVAQAWKRSLGAASRNVDRLQRKGYIEKRKLPDNQKTVRLYPTPAGEELAAFHRAYDRRVLRNAAGRLLEQYGEETLIRFMEVLGTLTEIFKEENAQ